MAISTKLVCWVILLAALIVDVPGSSSHKLMAARFPMDFRTKLSNSDVVVIAEVTSVVPMLSNSLEAEGGKQGLEVAAYDYPGPTGVAVLKVVKILHHQRSAKRSDSAWKLPSKSADPIFMPCHYLSPESPVDLKAGSKGVFFLSSMGENFFRLVAPSAFHQIENQGVKFMRSDKLPIPNLKYSHQFASWISMELLQHAIGQEKKVRSLKGGEEKVSGKAPG